MTETEAPGERGPQEWQRRRRPGDHDRGTRRTPDTTWRPWPGRLSGPAGRAPERQTVHAAGLELLENASCTCTTPRKMTALGLASLARAARTQRGRAVGARRDGGRASAVEAATGRRRRRVRLGRRARPAASRALTCWLTPVDALTATLSGHLAHEEKDGLPLIGARRSPRPSGGASGWQEDRPVERPVRQRGDVLLAVLSSAAPGQVRRRDHRAVAAPRRGCCTRPSGSRASGRPSAGNPGSRHVWGYGVAGISGERRAGPVMMPGPRGPRSPCCVRLRCSC